MRHMERLCGIVEDELGKIAEKGLSSSNLETAFKLIDMYKDIKNTEYWEKKSEYYMAVLEEMHGGDDEYSERGYSGRRNRDSRGRYSRDDGRDVVRGGYYNRGSSYNDGSHYDDGRSMRGVRGGYSRHDGRDGYARYMEDKQSYRDTKSTDCKKRLMDSLESYMDDFAKQMEEMYNDSDCVEERATIKRYIDKLKNIA